MQIKSRFAAFRGHATVRMRTEEIKALTAARIERLVLKRRDGADGSQSQLDSRPSAEIGLNARCACCPCDRTAA